MLLWPCTARALTGFVYVRCVDTVALIQVRPTVAAWTYFRVRDYISDEYSSLVQPTSWKYVVNTQTNFDNVASYNVLNRVNIYIGACR